MHPVFIRLPEQDYFLAKRLATENGISLQLFIKRCIKFMAVQLEKEQMTLDLKIGREFIDTELRQNGDNDE